MHAYGTLDKSDIYLSKEPPDILAKQMLNVGVLQGFIIYFQTINCFKMVLSISILSKTIHKSDNP